MVMTADAGMRRGAQRRAVGAGGWQVRATYRWEALCAGRGDGGQLQMIEDFNDELLYMGGRYEG